MRGCQEKVVHALQEYTVSHYPDMPSKFGELLLRMPELSRVCQVNPQSWPSQAPLIIRFVVFSTFHWKTHFL